MYSVNYDLIKKYCDEFGVSGSEENIRKCIEDEIKHNFSGVINEDNVGNLICKKGGYDTRKKIMVSAHMDEVGFQVMDDANGRMRVKPLGNIKSYNAVNQRVKAENGSLGVIVNDGVFDSSSSFYTTLKIVPIKGKIRIGDSLTFDSNVVCGDDYIVGKAVDNRISCELVTEILLEDKQYKNDIYFVFSTQEEIDMRGARVAMTSISPDIIIDVDASPIGERNNLILGSGAGIKISDSVGISDKHLVKCCQKIAEENKIMIQYEISDCGTTQLIITNEKDNGAKRIGISIPCSNMHTSSTLVKKIDVLYCKELLDTFLDFIDHEI